MGIDVFKAKELEDIAGLMRTLQDFNKNQYGEKPLHAEVILYRGGEDVALVFESDAKGELRFEVKS